MAPPDWLHPGRSREQGRDLSRRDFFARVAGRHNEAASLPGSEPGAPAADRLALSFHVGSFPYHDGPVLAPSLRVGESYDLILDPDREGAIRIDRGRDVLGYVPPPHADEVRTLLDAGVPLLCVSTRVDPGADLACLLEVRVTRALPAASDGSPGDPDRDG